MNLVDFEEYSGKVKKQFSTKHLEKSIKSILSSLMGCSAPLPKEDACEKGLCEHKSGRIVFTLIALQKLLDSGNITLDEFEINKAAIVGSSNR